MLDKIKRAFSSSPKDPEYVEIDLGQEAKKSKVMIRPFVMKKFEDVNDVLNTIREGYSIALVDIKPLRSKDVIELKRAISKIKKTAEAIEGNVTGFGDNILVVTPQFAEIYRAQDNMPPVEKIE